MTIKHVCALATVQRIVAVTAPKGVLAAPARELIGATAAQDRVVACAAVDYISFIGRHGLSGNRVGWSNVIVIFGAVDCYPGNVCHCYTKLLAVT